MTPFLKQTARHYFAQDSPERFCFVFPNRRSLAFFRKYYQEEVAGAGICTVAPGLFTINEFFYALSGEHPTDRVPLLLTLYDCYRKLNPKAEPLDDFIFWGDVILSDFEDVDKYVVDPEQIFRNVSEFKGIQDNFEYLSESQKEALKAFLGHFSSEGAIKSEFLRIWDILLPLYRDFNTALKEKGYSREGIVYRTIAEGEDSVSDLLMKRLPEYGKFVFVGLNALNGCERKLLRRMQKAGLAEFCWDYCGDWIKDSSNRSSLFLSEFTSEFPSAFSPDESGLPKTEFTAISVPSSIGQAKLLPALLSKIPSPGIETAIILPDETLLLPVLNSIPESIRDINVTMGYPMSGSALWSLMDAISDLQLHVREKDGEYLFYNKQVRTIFSNSILKTVADESEAARMAAIRRDAGYYVSESAFEGSPLLQKIFHAVPKDDIPAMEAYQKEIVYDLAVRLKSVPDMAMELDFAKAFYQAVGRLQAYDLPVRTQTYLRLLGRLTRGTAVPFLGEPLSGLQIMGPLETRALDFENVIILGCNEGVFPRRSVSSSFIPPELRRGFDLPTYEHQDAVWAYYFYRLIHRARKVTMIYDSRTEVSRSGEESRYIKQLEMHFKAGVKHYVLDAPLLNGAAESSDEIEKTDEDIETLRSAHFSASSLQKYLNCPAQFYYSTVKGLKPEDEINESLDAGDLGNVFHNVMEGLYKGRKKVDASTLKSFIADKAGIRRRVRDEIKKVLRTFEVAGRNLLYEDMVCHYVEKVLSRDLDLLKRYGSDHFTIEGVETGAEKYICGLKFVGRIDRLDSFSPEEIRIVDYKTGKVTDNDFIITDENAAGVVEALFDPECKDRPKIALQLYLYDLFVKEKGLDRGRRIVNSIYQTSRLFVKDVENVELCDEFCRLMKDALEKCLGEIMNKDVPWRRNTSNCEYCDFKSICGR